jgi:hypothetical protein
VELARVIFVAFGVGLLTGIILTVLVIVVYQLEHPGSLERDNWRH